MNLFLDWILQQLVLKYTANHYGGNKTKYKNKKE